MILMLLSVQDAIDEEPQFRNQNTVHVSELIDERVLFKSNPVRLVYPDDGDRRNVIDVVVNLSYPNESELSLKAALYPLPELSVLAHTEGLTWRFSGVARIYPLLGSIERIEWTAFHVTGLFLPDGTGSKFATFDDFEIANGNIGITHEDAEARRRANDTSSGDFGDGGDHLEDDWVFCAVNPRGINCISFDLIY